MINHIMFEPRAKNRCGSNSLCGVVHLWICNSRKCRLVYKVYLLNDGVSSKLKEIYMCPNDIY